MTSRNVYSASRSIALANRRSVRSLSTSFKMTIDDTPLGTENGRFLLDGLDIYSVAAKDDKHPLTVYGIDSSHPKPDDNILLMLHGRTWSSVPVYHLMGGPQHKQEGYESRSLMELFAENKIKTYAMDFRGFGGTPRDPKGVVEPHRCVEDVESVLAWIMERHETTPERGDLSLMGWSQGALVAQLAAQKSHPVFSKLILYGSIYDPTIRYPRQPLFSSSKDEIEEIENTWDGAVEDFTIEGSIPPETASKFAEAALLSDPIKANWNQLYQFNNCDPGKVHVPTLVIAGDQDPYAPLPVQQELFANLGRGSDRTLSILADADHAVHLLDGRERFAKIIKSFLMNGKRREQLWEY
ncbi:unnamed protein product [Cylindrotheca closterium]|uniref:Serine aminopeptidase S33 domain-containing protein n=1 Tax=Cylindrotheca closterium TaxID=2856 RepID=A0AAD2GCY3_9STRA|nr:unnamed protein product [Cylindrotheca closterium]